MFEKKFKYIFVRKEYSTLQIVGILKTNNFENDIRFKNRTFHIIFDIPSYNEIKTKIYILDFESGSQLKFEEIKSQLNPQDLDLFIAEKIVQQLTQSVIADKKQKIFDMIMGFIMGALLSAVLMFFYMQNQINEIYQNLPVVNNFGA